jgi:pimeloyl-ACP methyl ester carboxylesterase
MSVEIEHHTVRVGGATVRYQAAGHGQPILMIHGLSGSTRWWRPVVPAFAAHFRVHLINLPGFGAGLERGRLLPLARVPSWIEEWAGVVGLSRMHVLGHSMGGYIAMRLAAQFPERLSRMVLVDAAGIPVVAHLPGYALPLMRASTALSPQFLPALAADAMRAGPWNLLRAAMDLQQQDARPFLADIEAPTLIVWGQDDVLVPPTVGKLLHRGIRGSKLTIIPGAGHVPMYDRPRQLIDTVLPFLCSTASEAE